MPFDSVLFLVFVVGSLVIFAIGLAYASIVAPGKLADPTRKVSAHPANEQTTDTKHAA